MKDRKPKRVFFYIITFLPLCLLAFFVFILAAQTYRIKRTDYNRISTGLREYLISDKGDFEARKEGDTLSLKYNYTAAGGLYKPKKFNISFDHSERQYVIHCYGSSPLVSRLPFVSENSMFPAQLQSSLDSDAPGRFKVYNLGVVSFDSFDIKKFMEYTIRQSPPDLIIYYEGHMDYESAYLAAIKRNFYLFNGRFFRGLAGIVLLNKFDKWERFSEMGDWFLRSILEPNVLNLLQKAGFVKIAPEPFAKFNKAILEAYGNNISEIIRFARGQEIPIVFVTPVANLAVRPFGIPGITDEYYKRGMIESEYGKKLLWQRKALDSEIFSPDLRAKSGLNDFLRKLNHPGVYVLDLEDELIRRAFPFNYEYFYDAGHMKPALHKIIADSIYVFLRGKGLLRRK